MVFPAPERPRQQVPSQPVHSLSRAGFGDAATALRAVGALLDGAGETDEVHARDLLAAEARHFFGASAAAVLGVAELEGRVEVMAVAPEGEPPLDLLSLGRLPALTELMGSAASYLWKDGDSAVELGRALGSTGGARGALLLQMPCSEAVRKVLVMFDCTQPSSQELKVAR